MKHFLVIVCLCVGLFLLTSNTGSTSHSQAELREFAQKIVALCKDSQYRPSCYDKEIPKIMELGVSMENTFLVTTIIQEMDSSYWYCHVLGHNVSAKEVTFNKTPWNKVISRCPFGQCSNGCLHGAFQEKFRGETISDDELHSLMPEFEAICRRATSSRHLTGLEQASCYHAIGHLTMYVTNGRMEPSLRLCDKIAYDQGQDFRQLCYDGAFMQVFQPLEPEDEALVRDYAPKTPAESKKFCDLFEGAERASCHTESWPKYISQFKTNPRSIETFCGTAKSEQVNRCYNAVYYVMAPHLDLDIDRITNFCNAVTHSRGRCFSHSASRMVETDHRLAPRAVLLCGHAKGEDMNKCFEELVFYATYNYDPNAPEKEELCGSLPDAYVSECRFAQSGTVRNPYFADTF
jgi:hypothetical protein